MPVAPTYPGVYVQEIPSGVRTITGVATSITAFVGRALRGPVNEPVTINSFGDFERTFGGLWADGPLSYAVRDFFLNGGGQAIVVRLFSPVYATDQDRDAVLQAARAVALTATAADPAAAALAEANKYDTVNDARKPVAYAVDKAVDQAVRAQVIAAAEAAAATSMQDHPEVHDAVLAVVDAARQGPTAHSAVENALKKASETDDAAKDAANGVAGQANDALTSQASKDAASAAAAAVVASLNDTATLALGALSLRAASPGVWGAALRGSADLNASEDVAARYNLAKSDLFNLTVRDSKTGATEKFLNLSLKDSPRRIDRVLAAESRLVRWAGAYPDASHLPVLAHPVDDPITQAEDALKDALDKLDEAKKSGTADLTSATAAVTNARAALSTAQAAGAISDGLALNAAAYIGDRDKKTGLYALEKADMFNLLCIPPDSRDGQTPAPVYTAATKYCVDRRALLIVDPPADWNPLANPPNTVDLGISGPYARNAALYFPRVIQPDLLREGQLDTFVACGIVAGVIARTDAQRGVWKAPAGIDAAVSGVQKLAATLTDAENGQLNPLGINCLRNFPVIGPVVWGARTLRGADQLADEYKYIPVRRLALYIEESLYRGLQWVVFEPNDEPLWSQVRLNVGAFMHNLFRQGAFQGRSPREAYFVKCDSETTTQNDINLGIVNIVVGFAPLKPAEFVIISLQQMAGQIQA